MTELRPSDPAVDATVCIVNWNGAPWLSACLESLRKVRGLRHEAIVVDNASSDASVKLVRESFPEVSLQVNEENLGFAKATNQAIRQGRGRYFLLLNNDTALRDGCLESLVRFLDGHPQAGMVCGRLENADGSIQFSYFPVALPSLASLTADMLWLNRLWPRGHLGRGAIARQWDPAKPGRMEQVPGACMLVRREVLENVGLLDEGYRVWYEDVDFCARSLRAGWEIWYLPEARAFHHGGASTRLLGVSARSLWRFGSQLRYARRYFSPGKFFLLRGVVGIVLLMRLPIVVAAALWPSARVRTLWKGTWKAYLQILGEVLDASDERP